MTLALVREKTRTEAASGVPVNRLLGYCIEQECEEDRELVLQSVRLHRESMEAWAEHGQEPVVRPSRHSGY